MGMKAVVGIDPEKKYEAALALLGRLQFSDPQLLLAHVYRPVYPIATPEMAFQPPGAYIPPDLVEEAQFGATKAAHRTLEEAACKAAQIDPHPAEKLLIGPTAYELISLADRERADLICATAHLQGAVSCFVLGSVCRALVIDANQSVLIAKGRPEPKGPLKIVFATDHSPYAARCLDVFLSMKPAGIGEVTVLTVLEPQTFVPVSPEAAEAMIEEEEKYHQEMRQKTDEVTARFSVMGAIAKTRVMVDDPNTQIRETMEKTKADLLVMGAQGHGFIERLALGSTSLHQVVSENYPVLIVRPR